LVGDNGDGPEKVLNGLLCGKGDSNAADPKTGDDGSSIDTFNGEYYQEAYRNNQALGYASGKMNDRNSAWHSG
jgi:hypothetical protein